MGKVTVRTPWSLLMLAVITPCLVMAVHASDGSLLAPYISTACTYLYALSWPSDIPRSSLDTDTNGADRCRPRRRASRRKDAGTDGDRRAWAR